MSRLRVHWSPLGLVPQPYNPSWPLRPSSIEMIPQVGDDGHLLLRQEASDQGQLTARCLLSATSPRRFDRASRFQRLRLICLSGFGSCTILAPIDLPRSAFFPGHGALLVILTRTLWCVRGPLCLGTTLERPELVHGVPQNALLRENIRTAARVGTIGLQYPSKNATLPFGSYKAMPQSLRRHLPQIHAAARRLAGETGFFALMSEMSE